jgi:hypothetical protein
MASVRRRLFASPLAYRESPCKNLVIGMWRKRSRLLARHALDLFPPRASRRHRGPTATCRYCPIRKNAQDGSVWLMIRKSQRKRPHKGPYDSGEPAGWGPSGRPDRAGAALLCMGLFSRFWFGPFRAPEMARPCRGREATRGVRWWARRKRAFAHPTKLTPSWLPSTRAASRRLRASRISGSCR